MTAMTITVDGWMILEILAGASLGAFLQGYVSEWRRQRRQRRTVHVDSDDAL